MKNVRRTFCAGLLSLVGVASAACSHVVPKAELLRPAATGNNQRIVLLKGKKDVLVDTAAAAFIDSIDAQVAVFGEVQDVDADALAQVIRESQPHLVVTLGAQATHFAADHLDALPTLFAMVLNYKRYDLLKHDNIAGIAMEPTPEAEFVRFRIVAPDLHTVDLPFTETASESLANQVKSELSAMGITVRPHAVAMGGDAVAALSAQDGKADAIWLINDPWVIKQFASFKRKADAESIALLTSLSDQYVREGAFMSVSVDIPSVGSQAASMARLILEHGKAPRELGVQLPMGLRVAANRAVGKHIGRKLPLDVLPFISEVTEDTAATGMP